MFLAWRSHLSAAAKGWISAVTLSPKNSWSWADPIEDLELDRSVRAGILKLEHFDTRVFSRSRNLDTAEQFAELAHTCRENPNMTLRYTIPKWCFLKEDVPEPSGQFFHHALVFTSAFRGYMAFQRLLKTLRRDITSGALHRIEEAVLLWQRDMRHEHFQADNLRIYAECRTGSGAPDAISDPQCTVG